MIGPSLLQQIATLKNYETLSFMRRGNRLIIVRKRRKGDLSSRKLKDQVSAVVAFDEVGYSRQDVVGDKVEQLGRRLEDK